MYRVIDKQHSEVKKFNPTRFQVDKNSESPLSRMCDIKNETTFHIVSGAKFSKGNTKGDMIT